MEAGLYIHIPFCQKKCDYCDFYSITKLDQIEDFIWALKKEIEIRSPLFSDCTFHTLYFGGGTPSLLDQQQMSQIWEALKKSFNFAKNPEISLEANPGTLSFSKLKFLKEMGFNRLSLGVQSFNPDELQFLGRIHSVEEVWESFNAARDAGFDNVNIDLMTAFPGITQKSFNKSLEQIIKLQPEHVSCYTLIFEPGTVFYKKKQNGELNPLEDDEEASYYQMAYQTLEACGYLQYEISNFSKGEEYICKHNQIYWKHKPYVGLGPSAHSFYGNQRIANKRSLTAYISDIKKGELPVDFRENLSTNELMFEYIFMNLRLRSGINLPDFQDRFGVDYLDKFADKVRRLSEDQLIELENENIKLTETGWLLADSVAAYF